MRSKFRYIRFGGLLYTGVESGTAGSWSYLFYKHIYNYNELPKTFLSNLKETGIWVHFFLVHLWTFTSRTLFRGTVLKSGDSDATSSNLQQSLPLLKTNGVLGNFLHRVVWSIKSLFGAVCYLSKSWVFSLSA